MNKINIKDLSIIGVLSSLAFLCNTLAASFITPLLGDIGIYAHVGPSLLLSGVIFVVMLKKVSKAGCFIIFGAVFSILYSLIGAWQISMVIMPAALIAEILLMRQGYRSYPRIVFAYTVYGAIFALHPGFFVWVLGQSGIMAQFSDIFNEAQAQQLVLNYSSIGFISKVVSFTAAFAFVGALLGVLLYQKYFTEQHKLSQLH
ncbi:MptD family putative ECF transporter S component [Acinetobacter larvae]|uniref:Trep_Strep domain-containing protein n=1 Tax=Acinetobacter larvae TaxID=1789224 RepID=A0A1B2LYA3_9GAMM|nr:MptD family putative ECF transporter S component [Acinetobacter larvae]AOA57924.1 hypothetical protein BFG52_05870 [Acinetobacter larvae]